MNKKRRQELKELKYRKRLKYWVSVWNKHTTKEGIEIVNPTVNDLVEDGAYLHLKTQAVMCSCEMCSKYYKYRRHEFKAITKKQIKDGLDEFFNLD